MWKRDEQGEETMFFYIEEASSFWKELWEGNGTGNGSAKWIHDLTAIVNDRVPCNRTSPLSDYNRVVASNQFVLPVLGYLMWTHQWPVIKLKQIDREARKIVVESEGRHPCSSNALCCICQEVKEGGDCALSKWSTKPRKSKVQLDSKVMKTPPWKWYGRL